MSYFYAVSSISVLNKLHLLGLLQADERMKHVMRIRQLAVQTPDDGFLDRDIVSFLTEGEIEEILSDIRYKLLPLKSKIGKTITTPARTPWSISDYSTAHWSSSAQRWRRTKKPLH
jgi:hypothetical protein